MKVGARRPYRMTARAEATAATGERILDAAEELFWSVPLDQVSLRAVARGAGVSEQTVIRRFGSRDGVLDAGAARATERVRRQRAEAPVGDVAGAVRNLVDHYEEHGHRALSLLAREEAAPIMRRFTEDGRALHREWVTRTFAPQLARHRGRDRARRTAQLVAATDVYVWKLLRLDARLSRAQVERAVVEMIEGLEED
jgi:AcrR family transcriptional regulator